MKKKKMFFALSALMFFVSIMVFFTICASADDENSSVVNDTNAVATASAGSDTTSGTGGTDATAGSTGSASSGSSGSDAIVPTDPGTAAGSTTAGNTSTDSTSTGTTDSNTAAGSDSSAQTPSAAGSSEAPASAVTTAASATATASSVTTGWQTVDGYRLFYKSDGSYYKSTFATIGGRTYYFDSYGHLLYGSYKYSNGYYYYSDSSGVVQTSGGWITSDDGSRYYARRGGKLYSSQFIHFGTSEYYYMGKTGAVVKGVFSYSGSRYYAASNGRVKKTAGWISYNGSRYYARSGGALYTSMFIHFGTSEYYYMTSSGAAAKGVFTAGGSRYYADTSTGMVKKTAGWVTYNGNSYYVRSSGMLYVSQFIHTVDAATGDTTYYYMGSDGALQIGDFTVSGIKYTTDASGVINEEVTVVSSGSKGIDVSVYQGVIDWAKVKAAGIKFAIVRVGGRFGASGSLFQDSKYAANLSNAISAGIQVGVYFFSQATTAAEAIAEANYTYNLVKNYEISLPVAIDTEFLSGGRANSLSRTARTTVVRAFCDRIISLGYTPMVYSNTSWLNNQLNMTSLKEYMTWVAQLDKLTYTGTYACWQYSFTGKVSGISGNVDMNNWYHIFDSLID